MTYVDRSDHDRLYSSSAANTDVAGAMVGINSAAFNAIQSGVQRNLTHCVGLGAISCLDHQPCF